MRWRVIPWVYYAKSKENTKIPTKQDLINSDIKGNLMI
jgi:hypothetical protein